MIVPLCVAFVYSRAFHARVRQWHGQAVLVDAMGLALFTLTGVGFALHRGLPPFVASLIGVVTGTFGGVLRDVVSMEIPVIFRPGELYAVSSFAGAWVFLGASLARPRARSSAPPSRSRHRRAEDGVGALGRARARSAVAAEGRERLSGGSAMTPRMASAASLRSSTIRP